MQNTDITGSVAKPHHFDADQDPSFHFDADPDQSFLFEADPGSAPHYNDTNQRPLV
jgi:hypothetical protein